MTGNINAVTITISPDTEYAIWSSPAEISRSGVHASLFVGDVQISLGFGTAQDTHYAIDRLIDHLQQARTRFLDDVAALAQEAVSA